HTLDILAGMALTSVRLQGNRQKTFYKGIHKAKTLKLQERPASKRNLTTVRESLKTLHNKLVIDEEVWRSLRDRAFMPWISQFLWKAIHNAHRIGHYWTHIPECEERTICKTCGGEEDLEHILLKCESPGCEIIWKAA
ncbi:hypothetical protein K438DRAFT_1436117, partial [Mycena galopus ATCC 62051]